MINRQDPMIAAVVGYRLEHGEWPTRLRCGVRKVTRRFEAAHQAIAERIEVLPSADGRSWVAEGGCGHRFEFSEDRLVPSSARARGLFESWLASAGRSSAWLARTLGEPMERTELKPYVRARIGAHGIRTVGDVVRRIDNGWVLRGDITRDSLVEIAKLLYDRGLAFGMRLEERRGGVVVIERGTEPGDLFPRLDFEFVTGERSTIEAIPGSRRTVLEALRSLSGEHAELAQAALDVRPVLPGAAALERLLHSSLAVAARASRMTPGQLIGYAANRVNAYHDMATGAASTWRSEVEGAVAWLNVLDARAGLHFHGIIGRPCESYAEVAVRAGIRPERSFAFEAVESFNTQVRRLRPTLPVTWATLAVLRKLGAGASIERWWKRLPAAIRPAEPADLAAVAVLAEWRWARPVVVPAATGPSHVASARRAA